MQTPLNGSKAMTELEIAGKIQSLQGDYHRHLVFADYNRLSLGYLSKLSLRQDEIQTDITYLQDKLTAMQAIGWEG